ncbi:MAG: FAD-binding protein [Chloroflexota bacterium]|nr:FAD-binding protein [Chloroflexota bacterium]
MTSNAPLRTVIEGREPSSFNSVRRARAMLHNGPNALTALADDLRGAISDSTDVLVDRPSRLLYATDASLYEMEPVAVVFPRTHEDAAAAVDVARSHGVPVLPRGGGTSLAGQGVNHAVVLDFTRHMNAVLDIDTDRRVARVQPGLVLSELNKAARRFGLHYPIDPSTANRATIGGGIGNNSCGTHSGLYGKTVDVVESMEVILSDGDQLSFDQVDERRLRALIDSGGREGRLYRDLRELADRERGEIAGRFPDIPRRVSGYNLETLLDSDGVNLSQMVVGSEGTLAVVTEATVQLAVLPAKRGILAAHFRTLIDAAEATVVANAHKPAAIELVDEIIIERCRSSVGYAPLAEFVVGNPGAILLIECFAETEAELDEQLGAIHSELESRDMGYAFVTETDSAAQARMWQMRQAGLGLLMSMHGDPKPAAFVEDTAVPPERLPEFVARFDAAVRAKGLRAGYYGHAAAGCLHIRPVVNVKDPVGLDQTEALASEIADLVVEFGGSLSGEHGDGIVRGAFMEKMYGARLVDAFREAKQIFDPEGMLNPGKIIDTPPFRDNLRLSPDTINHEPPGWLDFSLEGGLARAAEMCNGQGACRKFDGGMCPSFMVTQDEEHSTRGRANLLRQVLNGAMPLEELSGDRLHDALDLCVECKACKAECPSGVDLAKIKYEVLAHRHRDHGVPLRDRAFANIATLLRLGSLSPRLANPLASTAPARMALQRLGVHGQRPVPRLAGQTFERWSRGRVSAGQTKGDVVLFDDTFTNFVHPEVGIAATRVIEALGYRVIRVAKRTCCGRPSISKGLLDDARELAQRNVSALLEHAESGIPIVGTEPSCLLTLRDEYPLLLRNEAAATVASQALLLDEWLASELAGEGAAEIFAGRHGELLLHAHCHQKALVGFDQTLEVLRRAGYEATVIESGCCGMAGSFGFEAEHYEISRKMGELRLFPAVREAGGRPVAITGVSCRQQIGHFTDAEPRHVVEYLADALRSRD